MFSGRLFKHNLKQVIVYGLAGIILGLAYIVVVTGFVHLFQFINGLIIGLFMGVMIGTFEVFFFQLRFQKHSFTLKILIRVLVYVASIILIILGVVALSRSLRNQQTFFEALVSQESMDYLVHGDFKTALLYAFVAAVVANFIRLISFKIGRGTLTDFFLGAYSNPKLTHRIFIFIQITNADYVLKNNPIEIYHHFLNDVYGEISLALMHNKGFVYDYIDNQIIVYWKGTHAPLVSGILNFYNDVQAILKQREEYFRNKVNITPVLRFAVHGGSVIQAEIGELKTDIVFHGDVLNTAARMLDVATDKQAPLIFSSYIFDRLPMPDTLEIASIGQIPLRGKLQPVSLYTLGHVAL